MSKIRQNISLPKVISRLFPWKFLQINITSVSGLPGIHILTLSNRCRHKYDSSISRIFRISFLANFCDFAQLCSGGCAHLTEYSLDVLAFKWDHGHLPPFRGVVPGCAGCAMAHPDLGRSINPISTRDRLCLPNYYWHPQIFRPSDGPAFCMKTSTSALMKQRPGCRRYLYARRRRRPRRRK